MTKEESIVGELINFRGLVYSPVNEQGVVFLFGRILEDLNMYIEEVRTKYPDCIARRYTGKGWEKVYIEFEYLSSNFLQHEHDPKECDVIVCWEDDLQEEDKKKLEGIEIIELISKQELENKELSEEDYQFIRNFGDSLQGVIADVEEKAQKTTIVADVHTDGNSGKVLEEGVGHVDFVVVAYKVPDGRVLIGAGPVMTYYEFKQPMSDRLTDEKWRDLLNSNPPSKIEWNKNFAVN